jgi:hypothetical protein
MVKCVACIIPILEICSWGGQIVKRRLGKPRHSQCVYRTEGLFKYRSLKVALLNEHSTNKNRNGLVEKSRPPSRSLVSLEFRESYYGGVYIWHVEAHEY